MRLNKFLPVLAAGSVILLAAGCGKGSIDAKEYSKALLDYEFRGDIKTYASLSGESEEELTRQYEQNLDTIADCSVYDSSSEPVPEQLAKDYRSTWEDVRRHMKYDIKSTEKNDDSYKITVETWKMNLFIPGNDIISRKWADYSSKDTVPSEPSSVQNLRFTVESWNEILEDVTYQDPQDITLTLFKDEKEHWGFSSDDITHLTAALIDDPMVFDFSEIQDLDPSNEGTPNMELPEGLDNMESAQMGEKITLARDGQPAAYFTLDNVKVTDQRLPDYDHEPEKVIVVTYTYENINLDDAVLIDDMSLQVLENDQVCQPYYIADLISTDSALKNEGPVTASFTYEVSSACSEVDLIVSYPWFDESVKIHASIEE